MWEDARTHRLGNCPKCLVAGPFGTACPTCPRRFMTHLTTFHEPRLYNPLFLCKVAGKTPLPTDNGPIIFQHSRVLDDKLCGFSRLLWEDWDIPYRNFMILHH